MSGQRVHPLDRATHLALLDHIEEAAFHQRRQLPVERGLRYVRQQRDEFARGASRTGDSPQDPNPDRMQRQFGPAPT
ncbi:hypothetical protein Prubr_74020 [Polymorphospora rubra]|uniref:Uncharacterized protein n=1 Tax=Polymorphospora rubra TaxID=338584 RepID=A0A810N946_9ACTN|nr:hypothetical protein Prubr_74020 [Polymorphospora rubra]